MIGEVWGGGAGGTAEVGSTDTVVVGGGGGSTESGVADEPKIPSARLTAGGELLDKRARLFLLDVAGEAWSAMPCWRCCC